MSTNKFQHLRDLQEEINRNLKEKEEINDLKHIRQQVTEYLLLEWEDINEYEAMLNDLSEIPEEPEDLDNFKQVLVATITTMLNYTEDPDTARHLNNMMNRLL
jgi:Sec7-like guanine-nucleotide exchange factor